MIPHGQVGGTTPKLDLIQYPNLSRLNLDMLRSLFTLAGSAINFALLAFGQQKDVAVDPQIVQQLHAIGKKSDAAFLKGDAGRRGHSLHGRRGF